MHTASWHRGKYVKLCKLHDVVGCTQNLCAPYFGNGAAVDGSEISSEYSQLEVYTPVIYIYPYCTVNSTSDYTL
jgi:hypothetical protein